MLGSELEGTAWQSHASLVREFHEPRTDVEVSKRVVPHPTNIGLEPEPGVPDGQQANYRATLPNKSGSIHIKEYDDHYKLHWDEVDPDKDPIGHLLVDAGKYVALTVVICAFAYAHYSE